MTSTMKLQVMSDLHFEFTEDSGASFIETLDPTGVDALVLAGDIFVARFGQEVRDILTAFSAKYPKVFYLPGNHEFYRGQVEQVSRLIESVAADIPNLDLLHAGRVVEFMGRRFLGGTLWFPDAPANAALQDGINDFRLIEGFVPWVYEQNRELRAFLQAEVRERDIVITHHLPSALSVPVEYRDSPLNCFFVSDETALIAERRPALWIHGHTHGPCDYYLGATRIVCNPRGYPSERNTGFNPQLVVEV